MNLPSPLIPPSPDALEGWSRVCYRELTALFDAAHEGLPLFVKEELHPLGPNLLRGLDVRALAFDVAALGFYAVDRAQGVERPLILPSEQALCRSFSRWSLGPDALDMFLARTFDLLGDALARRHGHVVASELIEEAVDRFKPVRDEVVRRLIVGPPRLRPAQWPTRYLTAPMLWGAAWLLLGGRGGGERAARRVVEEALRKLGFDTTGLKPPRRILRRLALAGAMGLLGAAVGSAAFYHAAGALSQYTAHLEGIEDLLLFGATQDDPERAYGPGLLALVSALEAHQTT